MKNEVSKVKIGELRRLVRDSISSKLNEEAITIEPGEKKERPRSLPETAIELTKAAHAGLKALNALKSKTMPTAKASSAVSSHLTVLEQIFNDIWQNPVAYLDVSPEEVVSKHEQDVDARYAQGAEGEKI